MMQRHATPCLSFSNAAAVVCIAVVTCLAAPGCGGTLEVVAERPLPETSKPKGLIVYPAAIMIPNSTALEYIARADDVANFLLERTELPVLGPFDYKSFRAPDEMRVTSTSTDLMTRNDEPLDLKGWLAVRLMVTENRAMNTRDLIDNRKSAKKKGQIYRQRGVEATVRVEVEVYEAMRGKRVAQIVIKDKDDVTAVTQEGDPRPGIKRLVRKALALLLQEAEPLLEASPMRRVRSGFVAAVPKFATFSTPGKLSFVDKFKDKDDTDRQAAMIGLWDRFHPGLPVKATFVAGKNPGLLVLKARKPFELHDVVLTVGGKPVYTMHQLDRRLQQCGVAGCEVVARRGFKDVKLHVNWQAVPKIEADE
jgi:hypothetical protein